MLLHNIYVLTDPLEPDHIRYVGYSRHLPETRLRRHIIEARSSHKDSRTYKNTWVRKLLRENRIPTALWIEATSDPDEAEKRWIQKLKAEGHSLTNGTDGGIGGPPGVHRGHKHSEETKLRWSQKRRDGVRKTSSILKAAQSNSGQTRTAEQKTRISEGKRKAWALRKEKGLDAHRRTYTIIFPDGHCEEVSSLHEWCTQNKISYDMMTRVTGGKCESYHGYACETHNGDRAQKIAAFIVANPKISYKKIATHFSTTKPTVLSVVRKYNLYRKQRQPNV
jgi:hypothetical protein